MKGFRDLLEATFEELNEVFLLKDFNHLSSEEQEFISIRYYSLNGDRSQLKSMIRNSKAEIVRAVAKVRYALLNYEVKVEDLSLLQSNIQKIESLKAWELWIPGCYFILALGWDQIKRFENSRFYFLKAYEASNMVELKKLAVRSLSNVVVADSKKYKGKSFIVNYKYLAKKALEASEPVTAGMCYLNMAQEYRKIHALNVAEDYCNKAIDLLDVDQGVDHYYLAFMERCFILIELDRIDEAILDGIFN